MVLLHQGSDEETMNTSGFVTDMGAPKMENKSELEQRVFSLESSIKHKDVALAKLKDELAVMKDKVQLRPVTVVPPIIRTLRNLKQMKVSAHQK